MSVCVVFYVKEKEEKESEEPQGEMVYLLQTASQGRSGREIKLQRTFKGVTLNVCTCAFSIFLKKPSKKENITQCGFVPCNILSSMCVLWICFRAEVKPNQIRSG